jgi:hypothetical protein
MFRSCFLGYLWVLLKTRAAGYYSRPYKRIAGCDSTGICSAGCTHVAPRFCGRACTDIYPSLTLTIGMYGTRG